MRQSKHAGKLAKHKRRVVSIAPGVICASLALAADVSAANECGFDATGPSTVTCTGFRFDNGIRYENSDGLTVIVDDPGLTVRRTDTDPSILVESNTTTTEDVAVIVRNVRDVSSFLGGTDILAHNRGLGAATVEFYRGRLTSGSSTGTDGGMAAWITNLSNTNDAVAVLVGGRIFVRPSFSAAVSAFNAGSGDAVIRIDGGIAITDSDTAPAIYGVVSQTDSSSSVDIRVTDGLISTSGNGSGSNGLPIATVPHGVWALVGSKGNATVLIEGGEIRTTGAYASGVVSEVQAFLGDNGDSNAAVSARMTDGRVETQGTFSHGVVARTFLSTSNATASARLDGGDIITSGNDAVGLLASNLGRSFAEAILTGGTIVSSGFNGKGVMAEVGEWGSGQVARVVMTDGRIVTSGINGHAVHSLSQIDAAAEIAMTGGEILTTADGAHGIFAERSLNFGTEAIDIAVDDGSIQTRGDGAHGIYALNQSAGLTKIQTAADISTIGDDTSAIFVDARRGQFDVDVTGGTLSTSRQASPTIRTIGASGGTIDIHSGATIRGTRFATAILDAEGDTDLRVAGTVLNGIDLGAGDDTATFTSGSVVETLEISLGEGSDIAIVEGNANLRIVTTLNGDSDYSNTTAGTDRLIFRGGGNFDAPGSLQGWETIEIDAAEVFLRSSLEVGTNGGDGIFLQNGGQVLVSGFHRLTGDLNIEEGSRYGTRPSSSSAALSLTGSVRNAGEISVQNGTTTGFIEVNGDYTGGGTIALDVDLAGGSADRLTINGDVLGPTTQLSFSNVASASAVGSAIPIVEVVGTTHDGDFAIAGETLNAGAYSYALNRTGNTWQLMPGLNASAGTYRSAGFVLGAFASGSDGLALAGFRSQGTGLPSDAARGSWVQNTALRFETAVAGTSLESLSGRAYALQFGYESALESSGTGNWVVGLTGKVGTYSASTVSTGGIGKIEASGFGLGVTGRWQGPNGVFFGAETEFTRLRLDYEAGGSTLASGETAFSFGASATVGQRIKLNTAEALIPSASLGVTHVTGQKFTDSNGTLVDIADQTRVTAQLGLGYERQLSDSAAIYAEASILHDFDARSSATVGGVPLSGQYEDSWVEVGFGGHSEWGENAAIFGDISYRHGVDEGSSALKFNAGIKLVW